MPRRRAPPSPPSPPPPQTQTRSGGGILNGVLSFVSREFESFVASATGASPAAGDSRRNLDEDVEDAEESSIDEDEDERRRQRRRNRSPPRKRTRHARSHSRKRTPSPDIPPQKRRSSSHAHKRRRRRSPSTESDQDSQSSSSSRVPSPEPAPAAPISLIRALKRRPSMTMPGSLFPRSPSMEPDFRPERDQRVRFTPSTLRPSRSPSPAPPPPDSSCQSSDVPLPESAHLRESSSSGSPSTPRRARTNVLSAADRFHVGVEDAGPSILLPSPRTSPTAYAATRNISTDKGKARALDGAHEGDTSGVLHVRGKEQELVAAREELDRRQRLLAEDHDDAEGETSFIQQVERDRDRDKARIRVLEEEIARLKQELSKRPTTATNASTDAHSYPYPPPPPPPPPPFPLPRKTIINVPSASDDPNLFASARASLKQAPPPVENPIVPVRRTGIATLGLAPDKMAAFLNEMKTVRLRKTASAASSGGKNVHDNGNATFVAPTPPSRVAQLAPRRSLEGLHQRRPLMDENPPIEPEEWAALRAQVRAEMDGADSRAGDKRKRGGDASGLAEDTRSGFAKRPAGTHTGAGAGTTSAHSSFASTSTSTSGSGSSVPRGLPRRTSTPLSSFSQPAQSRPQSRLQSQSQGSPPSPARSAIPPATTAWQTSSVTDAPTPSLCSDNENDNENYKEGERGADGWGAGREACPDDEDMPVTPLIGVGSGNGPSRSFFRFKGNGVPVEETDSAMDKSMGLGRAMDRSMNRSMNASMNRSLNRSMNTSTRTLSDTANNTTSRAGRAANASAPVSARPKATGIPRLKARPPPRPRAHSPPAALEAPPPQLQEDGDEDEQEEERPSTFIRVRDTAPRANIPFFAGRAPSSPMPKSPRRPRAPGRVASRESAAGSGSGAGAGVSYGAPGHTPGIRRVADVAVERYDEEGQMEEEENQEEEGHDERSSFLLPAPSLSERTPSPTAGRRPLSRANAAAPSQSQSQSQNQSRPKQSKSKTKRNKSTLKRRLTLDEELRSAVPFLHEDDDDEAHVDVADAHVEPGDAYMAEVAQQDADEVQDAPQEEEDTDSGVLVGVGTRSKRRGFLAHGGAGGTPVFMGVGYVEGVEEDVLVVQEPGVGNSEYGGRYGGEYADEEEDDYAEAGDVDDDDNDEYFPSPGPRARQGRGHRRR